jgi:hypothetical protein
MFVLCSFSPPRLDYKLSPILCKKICVCFECCHPLNLFFMQILKAYNTLLHKQKFLNENIYQ